MNEKLEKHRERISGMHHYATIRTYIYGMGAFIFITALCVISIYRFNNYWAVIPAIIFGLLSWGAGEFVYSWWYVHKKHDSE